MKQLLLLLFTSVGFSLPGFSQKPAPNVIYWNEARKLSTDDFTVVPDHSPKIKGDNLALTRTGITYALTSKPQLKTFEIEIYATIVKANSFIRERVLDAPAGSIAYLLNHEEKHFDISEIFAREAVKDLGTAKFSANHVKEIGVLMQRLFKQSQAMQDLYDKEIRNGLDAVAQNEWDDKISQHLQSLNAYKNKSLVKRYN